MLCCCCSSFSWEGHLTNTDSAQASIKARADADVFPHAHTNKYDLRKTEKHLKHNNAHIKHNSDAFTDSYASNHMNQKTHKHIPTHTCCYQSAATWQGVVLLKGFTSHTLIEARAKCVWELLYLLKSLCVAYTFLFFNADACVSEGVWVWAGIADICDGSDNSKKLHNNFISIYSIVCSDTCGQENRGLHNLFKNRLQEHIFWKDTLRFVHALSWCYINKEIIHRVNENFSRIVICHFWM